MRDQEWNLDLLQEVADRGLPRAIEIVDDSGGTGRCYLDLENVRTGRSYRIELTEVDL